MSSNPTNPQLAASTPAPAPVPVVPQFQCKPLPGNTCRYDQYPAVIVCQHCQALVTTTLIYENGMLTWGLCGGLILTGWILGCCLVPFFMNCSKDVEHRCPNCNEVVGKFRHCC